MRTSLASSAKTRDQFVIYFGSYLQSLMQKLFTVFTQAVHIACKLYAQTATLIDNECSKLDEMQQHYAFFADRQRICRHECRQCMGVCI